MLIAVLLFAESTVVKLGARRISPEKVRQINDADRIVIRKPSPARRWLGSDDRPDARRTHPDRGAESRAARFRRLAGANGVGCEPGADHPLPPRPAVGQNVVVQHDDEITSDELDELLDEAPTLSTKRPTEGTEVRLYVAVDADTLHDLEERAIAEGSDLSVVAAAALRNGARAA